MYHSPLPVTEPLGLKIEELMMTRSVEHLFATLWTKNDKKPIMSAHVIRIPYQKDSLVSVYNNMTPSSSAPSPPCSPDDPRLVLKSYTWHSVQPTYVNATHWRMLYGGISLNTIKEERKNFSPVELQQGSFTWAESTVPYLYKSNPSFQNPNAEENDFDSSFLPLNWSLSPEDYVTLLCDSGSGLSSLPLAAANLEFPNVDYNLILFNNLDGDGEKNEVKKKIIIGVKADLRVDKDGIAVSDSGIFDESGNLVGRSVQTLIVKKTKSKL